MSMSSLIKMSLFLTFKLWKSTYLRIFFLMNQPYIMVLLCYLCSWIVSNILRYCHSVRKILSIEYDLFIFEHKIWMLVCIIYFWTILWAYLKRFKWYWWKFAFKKTLFSCLYFLMSLMFSLHLYEMSVYLRFWFSL